MFNMYGVLGIWTIAEGRWEEQVRGLHDQVVPLVRQSTGFVAGYWLRAPDRSRSYSLILLEGEAAAQQFKDFVERNPANREQAGVTLESLVVAEGFAELHRGGA